MKQLLLQNQWDFFFPCDERWQWIWGAAVLVRAKLQVSDVSEEQGQSQQTTYYSSVNDEGLSPWLHFSSSNHQTFISADASKFIVHLQCSKCVYT